MLKEFKAFIMRGNVLDLAVGIIIGAAFGTIVKSLVDDVIMPPIGLALGNVDFSNLFVLLKEGAKAAPPYASLADARSAGDNPRRSHITSMMRRRLSRTRSKLANGSPIPMKTMLVRWSGAPGIPPVRRKAWA